VVIIIRANISDQELDMINEKIYLKTEIEVLNKKLISSENINQKHLESVINIKNNELKEVNSFLNKHRISMGEIEKVDDMFIRVHYSVKVDGGYKEGFQQIWRAAFLLYLKKRMSKYINVR
jgi:hypothetical protein